MSPLISVIIASHQERPATLLQTIESVQKTGGPWVEIIISDDGSCPPVVVGDTSVKVIRSDYRRGVGQARHSGVEVASAPFILLTDSHVIFEEGWLEPLLKALECGSKLLICGQCLAIRENDRDTRYPVGSYCGARMVIHDPDQTNIRWKILTAKWAEDRRGRDCYPLSAVMGACYATHKDWFLHIGGLKMLREFGGDEELLSIKTLLAGGEIRMCKSLRVGHKFRDVSKVPYRITVESCLYNTMMIAHTCCPRDVAKDLIEKVGPGREWMDAKEMVRQNEDAIEAERANLQGIFTRTWDEYLKLLDSIDRRA